jgi:hypothetical protein
MRFALSLLLVIPASSLLQGCQQSCESLLQLRAKYEDKCQELAPVTDPTDGRTVKTFVCGGRDGESYVSYKKKGDSYCFNGYLR